MGRKSRTDDTAVFAAVGRLLSRNGQLTLQDMVEETGISIGSLYHRYKSRENLMAQTWIDAVRHFHSDIQKAFESWDREAGEKAALATTNFCRKEWERAIVLVCCRKSEFITDAVSKELQEEIADINNEVTAVLQKYARHMGYPLEACQMGIVAFPLGAVRMYLPDAPVPESIDDYILKAYRSAVESWV